MPLQIVPFKEALDFGFSVFKKNAWIFIQWTLFFIGFKVLSTSCIGAFSLNKSVWAGILSVNFSILFYVIGLLMTVGFQKINLKLTDGQAVKFLDVFWGIELILKYFLAALLYGLINLIGFLLLIVPGIIWSMQFQFATILVVDKGLGPIEALKKSSEMTKGIKWNLGIFVFYLMLVNLLGALCFLVGLFVTLPATMVAFAYMYRKLVNQAPII